ncbi:MAG: SCO family protein [Neisseria sp.]|nr:SCO family protein [Neisseria sp.]
MKYFWMMLLALGLSACDGAADQTAAPPASAPVQAASAADANQGFFGSDVRAEKLGMDFSLASTLNQKISPADSRGKVTVLVFGYTHCPDICPTNLLTYAEAMQHLGDKAKDVQLYFITVDPERDTTAVLAEYVTIFYPSFVGLVPTVGDELETVKKAWRITSYKVPHTDGNYLVDHSTGTYLLDKNGETAIYEPHGTPPKQVAHDLELLLQ